MKIAVNFRQDFRREKPVITYGHSFVEAFKDLDNEVLTFGEGHKIPEINNEVRKCDLIIEIDSGRGPSGNEVYQIPSHPGVQTKKAVYLIDSHGKPDLHQSLAKHYDYVFYAVWIKRELFKDHKQAHWLPNASDTAWFGREIPNLKLIAPTAAEWGFFSSKLGLTRADPLIEVCKRLGYTYDVREVVKGGRHRWPSTPEAMRGCRYLFNFGQKCDSPNLRVMESMLVGRCLLTDRDDRDGMNKLFIEGKHYLGYDRRTKADLEEQMKFMMNNPAECELIADEAYKLVKKKHQIFNRAETILEVVSK